jgi:hypothetical protein
VSQDNPYPAGSEEAAWYEDQRDKAMVPAALAISSLVGGGALTEKPGVATLGSGPVRPNIGATAVPEVAPVFYSALEHAATNAKQDVMSPEQWQGYLKNQPGVKQEELQWTGLGDWLSGQKGKVSKSDVQSYLDEHKVDLQDVTKGGEAPAAALDEHAVRQYGEHFDDLEPHLQEIIRNGNDPTKYSSYQLPGGENYREHLLTMPRKAATPEEIATGRARTDESGEPVVGDAYKSSHWDEPNVLAHVRTNDRDVGGKKSLHIEEIQSDWHQQGRKQGYAVDPTKKRAQDLATFEENEGRRPKDDAELVSWMRDWEENPADVSSAKSQVPDAPFKTSWPELALKRMIRHAAENGYDRISWTPGEAQAARYDLSKQVEGIRTKKNQDGSYDVGVYPKGTRSDAPSQVTNYPIDKLPDVIGKDLAEKVVTHHDKSPGVKDWKGLDLKVGGEGMREFYDKMLPKMAEKIGKAHGVKVKTGQAPSGRNGGDYTNAEIYKRLQDQGSVGKDASYDSWIKGFLELSDRAQAVIRQQIASDKWVAKSPDGDPTPSFDSEKELDAWIGKNAKSWGFKPIDFKKSQSGTQPVHYFDLPQSLKDQALHKGFPLFMSGVPFPLTPVDHDPFQKDKAR